jgi:hypothetical protein
MALAQMINSNSQVNPLVGTWHLRRWEIGYDDQRPHSYPFGADAVGMIIYSPDGWMSACIAKAARARMSSESVRSAPVGERLAAFESYFQYAGRYRLEEGEGVSGLQVVHEVTHTLNPNFLGTRQVRLVDLSEPGVLILSASDVLPGSSLARHHQLIWQRAVYEPSIAE